MGHEVLGPANPTGWGGPWGSLHCVLGWTGFCAGSFVALSLDLTPFYQTPPWRFASEVWGQVSASCFQEKDTPNSVSWLSTCRTSYLAAVTLFWL